MSSQIQLFLGPAARIADVAMGRVLQTSLQQKYIQLAPVGMEFSAEEYLPAAYGSAKKNQQDEYWYIVLHAVQV